MTVSPSETRLVDAQLSDALQAPHPAESSLDAAKVSTTTSQLESAELASIDEEISRAESAHQLMLVADTCLRSGADQALLLLGFSAVHIAELRSLTSARGGYPAYALRNIRQTIRFLRNARRSIERGG